VAYWIRRCRPDVVLGHDPWRRWRLHPDHRNAGFLACDGVVAARDPHFFPEQQLPHWRPTTLLLWEADEPDHVELVPSDEVVEAKLAALLAHESQFRSTMKIDDTSSADQVAAFRTRVLGRLGEHGALARVERGEAFKAIREL
jgi:LmbE family N-acetylglucosaminyl deacetylase